MYSKKNPKNNVFQYQRAKFNNAKPQLFLCQPNISVTNNTLYISYSSFSITEPTLSYN